MSAASLGKDKGATFTLTLPLARSEKGGPADAQEERSRSASQTAKKPADFHGLRILVVEDDPETREALVAMLGQSHADVRGVASAAEAMQVFGEFRPETLVCDIAMPVEDGYSLVRRIRTFGPAQGGQIPALALTAFATEEDRQRAFAACSRCI